MDTIYELAREAAKLIARAVQVYQYTLRELQEELERIEDEEAAS